MLKEKRRPATYADIEALPDNMVGQIAFGVLHAQPRPRPRHATIKHEVQVELGPPFGRGRGGPGGWLFASEPELHLGAHVLVPDIAAWRRERMPRLPETPYFETPPDWVCEVLSPTTMRLDRTDKLAVYAEFGIPHAWYLNPDAKTLEVFELSGGRWFIAATFKEAEPVTAPPFEAHTFALDVLWPPEDREPAPETA